MSQTSFNLNHPTWNREAADENPGVPPISRCHRRTRSPLTVFLVRRTLGHVKEEEEIEQFMREYFRARTATFEAISRIRQPFRNRYYDAECLWGSHRGEVERSESERIVNINCSSTERLVVTTGFFPPSRRTRYHVKRLGEVCLIHQVDTQCIHLFSKGDPADCLDCGGSSWQNYNRHLERMPPSDRVPSISNLKALWESTPCDPDVVRFMDRHCTERAAVRQKELQLYSQFTSHFHSSDCDQPWSGYRAGKTETESVVNTKVTPTWARVITKSPGDGREFWLRYNLRRVGETWLIIQVDLEATGPDCKP